MAKQNQKVVRTRDRGVATQIVLQRRIWKPSGCQHFSIVPWLQKRRVIGLGKSGPPVDEGDCRVSWNQR